MNDASSSVRMPLVRHGQYSSIVGGVVAGYRLAASSTAEMLAKWLLGKASGTEGGRTSPGEVPGVC